jgi:signal transduction histidine kinase
MMSGIKSAHFCSKDDQRPASWRFLGFTSIMLLFSLIFDFLLRIPTVLIIAEFLFLLAVVIAIVAWQRHKKLWGLVYGLAWVAFFLCLYSTGGAQSPFFASQMIVLLLAGAFAFREARAFYIFLFTLATGVGWIVFSLVSMKSAVALPPLFVIKHNAVLMFGGIVCLTDFLTQWQNQKYNLERQSKRLLEVEDQLFHAEKMAEIGKLVATTAHELAQPAQVIMTSASLLHGFVSRGHVDLRVMSPLAERLLEASDRLSRLLSHLKNFSRKETSISKARIDVRDPLSSVSLLLDHDLRNRGVRFEMHMPSDPIWISGDAHRLQQVFLNLLNNARDASLHSERPLVSIRCEKFSRWIRVLFSNNGCAIPLDVQGKLFEPYFTTKPRGEGTGLGLSICKQLIEEHSGRILFSSLDEKTVFVVDLPLLEPELQEAPSGLLGRSVKLMAHVHRSS